MSSTEKLDFRKVYHHLYSPSAKEAEEILVPELQFAMVDGEGPPEGSEEFQNAIAALYGVTYTMKFSRKKAGIGPDYSVSPLEGLWWMADGADFDMSRPADWRWTLMIMQPDFITHEEFTGTVSQLTIEKPSPLLSRLRLELFNEGKVVQILHIGPYDQEARSLHKLEAYAKSRGYTLRGKHHEIYLGDPRRAKPDKLRTILRHPISNGV
jgi:hypothetical protein